MKFHQDFPYEPHSNEDIMTVLYFLDDVTLENGPLEVILQVHTTGHFIRYGMMVFLQALFLQKLKLNAKQRLLVV